MRCGILIFVPTLSGFAVFRRPQIKTHAWTTRDYYFCGHVNAEKSGCDYLGWGFEMAAWRSFHRWWKDREERLTAKARRTRNGRDERSSAQSQGLLRARKGELRL
jgi:hypothetical protein